MQPMLNIALRAARLASENIQHASEKVQIIRSEKSELNEFITETSIKTEQIIAQTLQKAYPNHEVIGQFTGAYKASSDVAEATWQISAIDSIKNFSVGLPDIAICLAGTIKGKTEHCVILNPTTGEEFTASRGHGAILNGRRIRVNEQKGLEEALCVTNFQYEPGNSNTLTLQQELTALLNDNRSTLLNTGSAALNFAYTAAGRYDAAFATKLQPSCALASELLLQEAGSLAGDLSGGTSHKEKLELVCANAKLFKPLLKAIRKATTA